MKPNIITISGPSAVGKTFFIDKLIERHPNIKEIIGLTTRDKRVGEVNGKFGLFITMKELENLEDRKLENDIIIARELLSLYEKREKNDKEEK